MSVVSAVIFLLHFLSAEGLLFTLMPVGVCLYLYFMLVFRQVGLRGTRIFLNDLCVDHKCVNIYV